MSKILRAILCTTALTMQGGLAFAQERPPMDEAGQGEEETIVVTGFRDISKPVQQTKEQATQIVDTLTQREIERMPDRSLAEVLDRVVGVSSDRGFSSSQPRTVTLRGFDARYNSMDVDGNLIWNSSRNNRGTQLDVFPASVINQINVYKTVTPEMDANSIGGHLELRTLRAFDGGTGSYLKARAAMGYYEQNGMPDNGRPSFRADFAGKFTFGGDNQFGAVFGAEYQQNESFDHYNEVTSYSQIGGTDVLNGNIFQGIFQQKQERKAIYGKLEARSSDKYYAFVSASLFDDDIFQTFNRGGPFVTGTRVTDAAAGTGNFTKGTAEIYFEEYTLKRRTLLLGSGLDYRLGDRTALNLRAAYTNYDHDEMTFRSERFQITDLTGRYDIGRAVPEASFDTATAARISDPANWIHRTGRNAFIQPIPHRDNVFNASADINFNAQDSARGFGVRSGVYFRRLDRNFDQTTDNYNLPAGNVLRLSDVLLARAGSQPIDGVGPIFIDRDAYRAYMLANMVMTRNDVPTTDYRLKEDVWAGHIAATFATDHFRALVGFRVEQTKFDNETANTVSGSIVPETRHFKYTEFLPNIQLSFEPISAIKLRAAYTETIGRPDFSDFANGYTVSFNAAGVEVVSGSNPYLEPRKARNYDASIEYYFGGGYLSLGLFQKNLRNETFRQVRETRDADGILTKIETIPLNTGTAKVQGLELSLVKERFDFLPGLLSNFGLNANYTLLDGDWNVVFTDGSTRTVDGLRNQPKWLGNVVLSYNQDRFAANLGYRLRGRTFTGSFGATEASDLWIDNYARLDAQISFKLFPKLTLFAEGKNLTNRYWVEQTGIDADALSNSNNQGRVFWFGVTYKM